MLATLALGATAACSREPVPTANPPTANPPTTSATSTSATSTSPSTTPPATTSKARLVVLSPGLAVILRDMSLGDRIVARHAYDSATTQAIPAAGDEAGIDEEVLLRVAPTAVLLQQSARPISQRLLDSAQSRGFEILTVPMLSLEDIPKATRAMDALIARLEGTSPTINDPASATSKLLREMDRAWTPRTTHSNQPQRVLLLISVDPPAALGPGSWHHDMLVRLGGTPAITQGSPYIELDTESLLRLAPDAIVLITTELRSQSEISPALVPIANADLDQALVRARLASLAKLNIPAFINSKLAAIDDPLSLTPSSAMIPFADRLRAILIAWQK